MACVSAGRQKKTNSSILRDCTHETWATCTCADQIGCDIFVVAYCNSTLYRLVNKETISFVFKLNLGLFYTSTTCWKQYRFEWEMKTCQKCLHFGVNGQLKCGWGFPFCVNWANICLVNSYSEKGLAASWKDVSLQLQIHLFPQLSELPTITNSDSSIGLKQWKDSVQQNRNHFRYQVKETRGIWVRNICAEAEPPSGSNMDVIENKRAGRNIWMHENRELVEKTSNGNSALPLLPFHISDGLSIGPEAFLRCLCDTCAPRSSPLTDAISHTGSEATRYSLLWRQRLGLVSQICSSVCSASKDVYLYTVKRTSHVHTTKPCWILSSLLPEPKRSPSEFLFFYFF